MEAVRYARVILAVMAIFILTGINAYSATKAKQQVIGAERVRDMLKEGSGLWLIDVRGKAAYEAEHIEGSVNIPSSTLAFKKFPVSRTLILVDDSIAQKASNEAADLLVKKGYEKVYVLDGGIVSWRLDGYPVVEPKPFVRGITSDELKRVISGKMPIKIFDMRNQSDTKKGRISGSESVKGKDIREKAENLKALLKKGGSGDLSSKLKKAQTMVLVFSLSDDVERYVLDISHNSKADIRYLIGGYEAFITDKHRQIASGDSCPTCPENKKK
jgi:rhodanese-related sulfurtransferase